jgi:drug/metabolite transporter (DMT)-like permease
MRAQQKAYLYAFMTVLLWSTVASAFKLSLRYLDPIQLLLYASAVSSLVLIAILTIQGRLSIIFSYSPAQYLHSLQIGILNPFLYYIILFKAYALLPAQVAQPLNYTWALTLTYLSVPLLRQKIGLREISAGIVCYLGVLMISSRGQMVSFSSFDPLGVVLALASTVIWALSWILNTRDDRDPIAGLLLSFLFSLPFIFVACILFSDLTIPGLEGLLGAAYVGIFEMGITFVFWLTALKLSENTAKVGNLIFLSPFLSLIFIHFIVGETILPSTFIGLVFIVAGLVIQSTGKKEKRRHSISQSR